MLETRTHMYSMWFIHDPIATLTSAFGAVFYILLFYYSYRKSDILRKEKSNGKLALFIFSVAASLMYSMSMSFHALPLFTQFRDVFQYLDHATIWTCLATSLTSICLLMDKKVKRALLIITAWIVCGTALVLKMLYFGSMPESLYPLIGLTACSGAFAWYCKRYGFKVAKHILVSVIFYIGAGIVQFNPYFSLIPRVIESHEIFHILSIFGTTSIFMFLLRRIQYRQKHPVYIPPKKS